MRVLRSSTFGSSSTLLPGIAFALAVASTMPVASAFSTTQTSQTVGISHSLSKRKRKTTTLGSSRRGEDLEDQLWSIRNSWKAATETEPSEGATILRSDVPSDNNAEGLKTLKELKDRVVPPPPEDQFIMTGDIAMLFLYAFTSHSINDSVVTGLLEDPKMTIPDVVKELDPLHDVVNLQHPVWVDLASNPNVPFGNPSVDHALEVSAREAFLNHWGPLLSTEGSACVALCTCWLIAGWVHRAFLFDNTTYCSPTDAMVKTVETWITAALLLTLLATGTDWLVGNTPALQSLFCVTCKSVAETSLEFKAAMAGTATVLPQLQFFSLTQSDIIFIVDSLTILIAWRWSAHRILNIFR